MRPQSCKAKGRRLQQKVAADLLRVFGGLAPDDVRSTPMGTSGEDIQLSPAAQSIIPFSFEVKNQERLNIWTSVEQAVRNSRDREPCVVFKKNNSEMYAVVRWSTFLGLLSPPCAEEHDALGQLAAIKRAVGALEKQLATTSSADDCTECV